MIGMWGILCQKTLFLKGMMVIQFYFLNNLQDFGDIVFSFMIYFLKSAVPLVESLLK